MSLNAEQPTPGTPAYSAWVEQQNQALAEFRRQYEETMRAQGVTVTWNNQNAVSGPYALIDPGNATLSRDGFTTEVVVSRTRAQQAESAEALARFDTQFNLRYQAQIQPGELPSQWYIPESNDGYQGDPTLRNAPGPQWTPPPGPSPTVTTPSSVQPEQTPPNPNSGTMLTNPLNPDLQTIRRNWDEWNWYYQQETGRPGPPPEDIPGAARGVLYTRAEWWNLAGPWYGSNPPAGGSNPPAGGSNPPAGGGGGSNPPAGGGGSNPPAGGGGSNPPAGGGTTPPKVDYTVAMVVAGIIAFLALKG